ncbi:MAG TPA: hypothetical protein PK340_02800 [Bacilli bacterium]|nr:hypothetical protein [Bacilli bacterium]
MSVELVYLNIEQLQALFHQKHPFIIAYLRAHCPDSHYGETEFLKPFLEASSHQGIVYAFDFEQNGFYDLKTMSYRPSYQVFLHEWGLSQHSNPRLGYGKGHVPSFQYIEPNGKVPNQDVSVIMDNLVIYNDIKEIRNDDKIVIGTSFFDGTRPLKYTHENLKGRQLPAWRRVEVGVYHNKLAKAFFEYYLPKISTKLLIDR